jgi:putative ABC transport system substrate-binding protein
MPHFTGERQREIEAEARVQGVALQFFRVRAVEELDGVFNEMIKAQVEALVLLPHPAITTHARQIVVLAERSRLPAIYPERRLVQVGGLMAYAADLSDRGRRLADYVDRILKGAKPGDLPVEQPSRFILTLNLKTGKALGLTIPPTLLIQAEEVIH